MWIWWIVLSLFLFKQKTAYEMRISDWSSDVCSSDLLNGRVVVQPGAQKTDSDQRIANLMLAKGAEINAKPELEIYADDVKCAHGATCGQLDDTAVFYLRTRGVPEAQARALLPYKIGRASCRERVCQYV